MTPKPQTHYSKFADGESSYVFSVAWKNPYKCKFCDSFFKTETAVYQHCKREVVKEAVTPTNEMSHTPTLDETLKTLAFLHDYFREGSTVSPDSMFDENETIKERVTRLLGNAGWLQGMEALK